MTALTLAEIKRRYVLQGRRLDAATEALLRADARPGAKAILDAIARRRFGNRSEGQRLRNLLRYEGELWERGVLHVEAPFNNTKAVLTDESGNAIMSSSAGSLGFSGAQIERSSSSALLKKAADKDDCADMVVTMCRTETMTGQTVVIDSGRMFH